MVYGRYIKGPSLSNTSHFHRTWSLVFSSNENVNLKRWSLLHSRSFVSPFFSYSPFVPHFLLTFHWKYFLENRRSNCIEIKIKDITSTPRSSTRTLCFMSNKIWRCCVQRQRSTSHTTHNLHNLIIHNT